MCLSKGKIAPEQFEGIQWSKSGALTAFPSVYPGPHIKEQGVQSSAPRFV